MVERRRVIGATAVGARCRESAAALTLDALPGQPHPGIENFSDLE